MTTLEQASFPPSGATSAGNASSSGGLSAFAPFGFQDRRTPAIRLRIQRQGRRNVREESQSLREVTQHLLGARIVLLREQTEAVRGRCPLFEDPQRLSPAALLGEALHQPESAGEKHPFLALQAVDTLVAENQTVARELLPNDIRGTHHPLVVERDEIGP